MNKKKEGKERQREKERKGEDKTNKFEEVRFSNKKKKNKVDLLEILIKATKNYVEKEINETSSLFNWYR